jgi:hypothetical protein
METQMADADDWDHVILHARPLTPQRWDVIKRAALRRASEARIEAVRAMLGMLGLALRPIGRPRQPRAASAALTGG